MVRLSAARLIMSGLGAFALVVWSTALSFAASTASTPRTPTPSPSPSVTAPNSPSTRPISSPIHVMATYRHEMLAKATAAAAAAVATPSGSNALQVKPAYTTGPSNMSYYGGLTMPNPAVYATFWGDWSQLAGRQGYITSFLNGVGGGAWGNVLTQYGIANSGGWLPPGHVWNDTSSVPASPSNANLDNEAYLSRQHFGPYSALYFVFVPPNHQPSFYPGTCGMHSMLTIGAYWIASAYIGYLPDYPSTGDGTNACYGYQVNPTEVNDSYGIVVGHEFAEAVTDTDGSGWNDGTAQGEIGDKCDAENGPSKSYPVRFGNVWAGAVNAPVAVQGLWSNAESVCALAGKYNPITPVRITDTTMAGGGVSSVGIAGQPGVPASGVAGAVMNVTAVNSSSPGYLVVYPAGTPTPPTSSVNYPAGAAASNLVESGTVAGQVSIYNYAPGTRVIVDLLGWISLGPTSAGSLYTPYGPSRILDTRSSGGPLGAGETRYVTTPFYGITAVAVNLTAILPSALTYLTAAATNPSSTGTSNLNPQPGQITSVRVVTAVDASYNFSVFNSAGTTDIIIDVVGYYTTRSDGLSRFVHLPASRLLDTRGGVPLSGGSVRAVQIRGAAGGLPVYRAAKGSASQLTQGVVAVVSVTILNATSPAYLQVWPYGSTQPSTSDINVAPGQAESNLILIPLDSTNNAAVWISAGTADLIVDTIGYYS